MKNKPLILFFPFNLLSHYLRCLQLAQELRNDFEIAFCYSETYEKWLVGYSTFHCEVFASEEVMACAQKFDFSWLNIGNIDRVFLSQVSALQKLKPEMVIGDAAFTLKMAAEKCNVSYISVINGYMSKYYLHARKLSKTHSAHKHLKNLPGGIADGITQFAERWAFKKVHRPFRVLRKKYHLKKFKTYPDELEGDHTLICDVPQLFTQKALPATYQYIGPLFYSTEAEEEEIIARLNPLKPTILASLGSSGNWQKLNLLNDDVFHEFNIITAGDNDLVVVGNHVISKPFINNVSIMPLIDLMICHGGNGTIYQALLFNVPILGTTSHFEQEWNMHRIEQLDLGAFFDDVTSVSELKSLVLRMIGKKPVIDFRKLIMNYTSDYRKEVLNKALECIQNTKLNNAKLVYADK